MTTDESQTLFTDSPHREQPMISCLTITQEGRQHLLKHAIGDFLRQTWPNRELVVVHDGNQHFQQQLEKLVPPQLLAVVRICAAPAGLSLGELRNHSLDHARGEFVCQWDDDDRCHPRRLELQMAELESACADVCFLVDQLHHFVQQAVLRWDDWNLERFPYNLIPGTLLGKRSLMARYPNKARGEDSDQVDNLLRKGAVIARVRGKGWLYVYSFTGVNTFAEAHHRAISDAKPMRTSKVLCMEADLRKALSEYVPPLPKVRMPLSHGELAFD